MWSKKASLRASKDKIAKFNNSSYRSHYFGASTVTIAEFVLMAVLSVINVSLVNWFQSEGVLQVSVEMVDSIWWMWILLVKCEG
jgi:hypothetical protein